MEVLTAPFYHQTNKKYKYENLAGNNFIMFIFNFGFSQSKDLKPRVLKMNLMTLRVSCAL